MSAQAAVTSAEQSPRVVGGWSRQLGALESLSGLHCRFCCGLGYMCSWATAIERCLLSVMTAAWGESCVLAPHTPTSDLEWASLGERTRF